MAHGVAHAVAVARHDGGACRNRDVQFDIQYEDRLVEGRLHPGDEVLRGFARSVLFDDDGEFIAAHARHEDGIIGFLLHDRGDVHENGIADGMAQGIVEGVEGIDVEEHDAEIFAFLARGFQSFLKGALEVRAVRQSGERIEIGKPLQRVIAEADVGDEAVEGVHHHAGLVIALGGEIGVVLAVLLDAEHRGGELADRVGDGALQRHRKDEAEGRSHQRGGEDHAQRVEEARPEVGDVGDEDKRAHRLARLDDVDRDRNAGCPHHFPEARIGRDVTLLEHGALAQRGNLPAVCIIDGHGNDARYALHRAQHRLDLVDLPVFHVVGHG